MYISTSSIGTPSCATVQPVALNSPLVFFQEFMTKLEELEAALAHKHLEVGYILICSDSTYMCSLHIIVCTI